MVVPPVTPSSRYSRRSLVATSLAGVWFLAIPPLGRTSTTVRAAARGGGAAVGVSGSSHSPANWRTWLLTSSDELRPAAPAEPTTAELAELRQLQEARDENTLSLVHQWGSRPAVLPWTDVANAAFVEFKLSPVRQARAQGPLQTAMYDSVIAAYDAQDTYQRLAPSAVDVQLSPIEGFSTDRPAFPSAEAAVAGAAATVLADLLPDAAPGRFGDLAQQVAETRLAAGLNVRSDIDAGLALGQAIGKLALQHGAGDRSGADWDGGGRLEGEGYWAPTSPAFVKTPLEPLAGTWKLWVLESPDQFRPAPPPTNGSPAWHSQLAAVQDAVAQRTFAQAQRAKYWQNTSASTLWNGFAADLISRDRLDLPHAARVLALLAVAQADAQVANYDGKYTYWTERPITADPKLDVLFPTPPFPSYPSSHATVSNAGAVMLSHLFPEDAADLLALAEEAATSRCWAGIHYPLDDDAGTLLGRQVGYLIADVARRDGAD